MSGQYHQNLVPSVAKCLQVRMVAGFRLMTLRCGLAQSRMKMFTRRADMQTNEILDAMVRTDTDELTFFRLAHIHCFKKDVDVHNDVAQFKINAVIPPYVLRYARYVFENDI